MWTSLHRALKRLLAFLIQLLNFPNLFLWLFPPGIWGNTIHSWDHSGRGALNVMHNLPGGLESKIIGAPKFHALTWNHVEDAFTASPSCIDPLTKRQWEEGGLSLVK